MVHGLHHELYVKFRRSAFDAARWKLTAYRNLTTVLRSDVDRLLNDRSAFVFLAESVGFEAARRGDEATEALGYITGRTEVVPERELSRRGIVEDWFVVPGHRGTGVGEQLLTKATEHCRSIGCDVMESTTWPDNERAVALHEKAGFLPIELKMRRPL